MTLEPLTVLTTRHEKLVATKHYRLEDGVVKKRAYGNAATFDGTTEHVGDVFELSALLKRLESQPRSFLIRGVPREGVSLDGAKRRKAIFEPHAGRRWLPIDIDDLPLPATSTAVERDAEGRAIAVRDPARYVRDVIAEYLPAYLQNVTCHYQFSSSAGMVTGSSPSARDFDNVRLRLHFWLSEPLTDEVLRYKWCLWINEDADGNATPTPTIDPAIYHEIQVIYSAAPLFDDGIADPCDGWRSGLLRGASDVATIPAEHLQLPQREIDKQAKRARQRKAPKRRTSTGDSTSEQKYAEAALEGVADTLASLSDGRQDALYKAAFQLAGYAHLFGADAERYLSDVRSALEDASEANGLVDKRGVAYVQRQVENGIASGQNQPLEVPTGSSPRTSTSATDSMMVTKAERRRRMAYVVGTKAQLDAKHFDTVIDVSTRYLSDVWETDVRSKLPDGPFIGIVQAHIGGAKSTALLRDADIRGDDVKIVTPLVELCSSLQRKADGIRRELEPGAIHAAMPTRNYRDLQNADDYRAYPHGLKRRIVITPNSDPKFNHTRDPHHTGDPDDAPIYTHKYVVYDEFDATVGRLSDGDVDNEQSMYRAMTSTIAGALRKGGKVYALSAYHNQAELVLLNYVRAELRKEGLDIPLVLVRNTHKPAVGHTYEVLEPEADKGVSRQKALRAALIARVVDKLKAGSMVAVASDSDAFAVELDEAIRSSGVLGDDEPLLLDATHKNEPRQREFLDDPDRDARAYRAIIYSPVLQTGFDIPRDKHEHELFAYLSARSIDPMTGVQLVGRFRGVQHMTLAVENYSSVRTTDVAGIKAELRESLDADSALLETTIDGRRVWSDPVFTDIHAHNIARDRWLRSAWRQNFLALLDDQGWSQRDGDPVRVTAGGVDAYDAARSAVRDAEASEVADAAGAIDAATADRLKRAPGVTKDEKRQLEAFDYQQFYGLEPSKDDVLEDDRGRMRAAVSKLANARAERDTILYHRDRDLTSAAYSDGIARQKSVDKLRRHALQRELSRAVLEAARINPDTLESTGEYSKDSDGVVRLYELLQRERRIYSALVVVPDDKTLQKSALPFVSNYLRQLGFRTEMQGRRDDRRPLEDAYFDELITPLEDGAVLEPTHPNRKRTKYRLTHRGDETLVDTRRVNHLLSHGVLKRGDDDVVRLEPSTLRETFVRASEHDTGDRTRTYRAVLDLQMFPSIRDKLEAHEGVVRARVERWRDEAENTVTLLCPSDNFLYRQGVGVDKLTTPATDGGAEFRDTSLSTTFTCDNGTVIRDETAPDSDPHPLENTGDPTPDSDPPPTPDGLEPLTEHDRLTVASAIRVLEGIAGRAWESLRSPTALHYQNVLKRLGVPIPPHLLPDATGAAR